MKLKHILVPLYFAAGITCNAQKPEQVLGWINTVRTDNRDFYLEIPFDYRNNEIVIGVVIGDQQYDYIFDTGGYNNITDSIQLKNNFPVLGSQTVGSSNKLKAKINLVKVDSLKIGGLVFKEIVALQMDYGNAPVIGCTIDGGLIGASIIKKFIWQIDYPNRKIIVTDRKDRIAGLQDATRIPVRLDKRLMPFINVMLDGRKEELLFDLGSGTQFSLTKKAARRQRNFNKAMTITGGGSEGANGVIKEDISVFKAGLIGVGSLEFINKPVVYLETNNVSLIGNPVIKDYIVTLNFSENEMFFKPINESSGKGGWNSFGFTLGYKDGKIKVITLYKGFNAEKQGLHLDDEILAIDGKPVECNNFCDCMKMLPEKFSDKDTVTLTVYSGNTQKELMLKKEKIFW